MEELTTVVSLRSHVGEVSVVSGYFLILSPVLKSLEVLSEMSSWNFPIFVFNLRIILSGVLESMSDGFFWEHCKSLSKLAHRDLPERKFKV